ncbi:Gfo/Idh/MocA family oxidoreductase [Umezawaea sp. Da 62-37]|uniref:Gfo/Idh/MocA family protein n=1 Tax=Umezawaea sp. Da 62-37 TaxID=3075927 RepID=UPI0028F6E65C|nr:Gfo/Idh/MocA family oxidoreductase [Umezawaea sp. Da 62-37]WNV88185.1 Gfo/Idh/MocA family oxidoreductase [Umezawaea sp. Da 62-37]
MGDHKRVRLGVVGLGAMGGRVFDIAVGHPDFEVVRAADVDQGAVDRIAAANPSVAVSTTPADVVDAADVDAVYIATPPSFHADLSVAALAAGKAVFCEKPLAISLEDGRRMSEAAASSGLATAVNFALSDRDVVLELERRLRAGQAGTVLGVDVRLQFPEWPRAFQADALWLDGREQGGFVREVFSHFAYLTDRLVGPLRAVDVSADFSLSGSEVSARGLLRAGGVPVHFSGMSGVAGPEVYEWTLWGSEESYRLRQWSRLEVFSGGDWVAFDAGAGSGSDATRLGLFAQAIRTGSAPNLADFPAAYRVQEAVEAFHVVS